MTTIECFFGLMFVVVAIAGYVLGRYPRGAAQDRVRERLIEFAKESADHHHQQVSLFQQRQAEDAQLTREMIFAISSAFEASSASVAEQRTAKLAADAKKNIFDDEQPSREEMQRQLDGWNAWYKNAEPCGKHCPVHDVFEPQTTLAP